MRRKPLITPGLVLGERKPSCLSNANVRTSGETMVPHFLCDSTWWGGFKQNNRFFYPGWNLADQWWIQFWAYQEVIKIAVSGYVMIKKKTRGNGTNVSDFVEYNRVCVPRPWTLFKPCFRKWIIKPQIYYIYHKLQHISMCLLGWVWNWGVNSGSQCWSAVSYLWDSGVLCAAQIVRPGLATRHSQNNKKKVMCLEKYKIRQFSRRRPRYFFVLCLPNAFTHGVLGCHLCRLPLEAFPICHGHRQKNHQPWRFHPHP